jgi:gliding motility-associated-like protein
MRLFTLLLFLCLHLYSLATHIVGGEIVYKYLNNNTYEIKLIVYRDCNPGNAPFDNSPTITIFNDSGKVVDTYDMLNGLTLTVLPITIDNPCVFPPTNICYEKAEYVGYRILPPIIGGYYITYQRCCRNNTILNLNSPGNQGATFIEHIPGLEMGTAWMNNSPEYSSLPPTFVCSNSFFSYDHSAIDIDGDSLAYSFVPAYKGLDRCCPILGAFSPSPGSTNGCIQPIPSVCPEVGYPPIAFGISSVNYDTVDYQAGFFGKKPFGNNGNVSINPISGFVSGSPIIIGQYVVTVQAKEYRNGILIGVHRREFQFNITSCQKSIISTIISPTVLCTKTVSFNSTVTYTGPNTVAYTWDFGDPASGITNVSTLSNPIHTFTDTGFYTVTFTAYDITSPNCKDVVTKTIRVISPVSANFSSTQPLCKFSPANFTVVNLVNSSGLPLNYNWNFNDPTSGTSNVSTIPNPIHAFTDTGTYQVTLNIVVPQNTACNNTITQTINVKEYVKAAFNIPTTVCAKQLLNLTNNSLASNLANPVTYQWQFANANLNTSNAANPSVSYNGSGTFPVKLKVVSTSINKCADSLIKNINVTSLQLSPNVPSVVCNSLQVNFDVSSTFPSTAFSWNFGDLSTSSDSSNIKNPSYTFPSIGIYNYTVKGIDTTNFVCKDSVSGQVNILDIITPDFTSIIPKCANLPVKLKANNNHIGPGNLITTWQVLQNNILGDSVLVSFPDSGIYTVNITATNTLSSVCKASINKPIKINPRLVAQFDLDTLYCRLLEDRPNNQSRGSKKPVYTWYTNTNLSTVYATGKSPLLIDNSIGNKTIFLVYKDSVNQECADTSSFSLSVAPPPIINITAESEKCKGAEALFKSIVTNSTTRNAQVYWAFSDNTTDSGNIVKHTFPSNNNFNVVAYVNVASLKYCSDTAESISINIIGKGELFVPNAFSPNKDDNNDIFKIEGPPYEKFLMLVYNRFGQKVFESRDQSKGWDGIINNEEAEPGVFGYYIEVICPDGKKEIKKGNVTLIR